MLLAIDVGNTHTRLAVMDPRGVQGCARLSTRPDRPPRDTRAYLDSLIRLHGGWDRIEAACIASVVPAVEPGLREALGEVPVHLAGPRSRWSFTLDLEAPETVGADRLVNAEAALELASTPLVVVDAGTAITVCGLGAGPVFLGGAIAPGVGIASEALFARGARLPRVELVAPRGAIGRSTPEALQSGLVLGFAGLVDGLIERFQRALGGAARVVSTGGGLAVLGRVARRLGQQVPDLTMRGLWTLARREGLVGG